MPLQVWLPLTGDLSNNGLHDYPLAIYRGNEVYNDNGKLGKCFYSNGVNTIKISNIIPDFYSYTAYSLCAWFYIEAQNTVHTGSAVISGGNWNNQVLNLAVSDWSTDHYTRLRISGTSWGNTYTYNFNLNTWYHVVVSSDGNKTYAYVNGSLIGDTASGFLPSAIEGNDICVGGATYYSGMQFFGKICDVRIYDHCLSPKEVKLLSQGLVAHYQLNGDGRGLPNLANNTNTTLTDKFGYSEQTGGSTNSIVLDNGIPCIKITRNSTEHSGWDYLHYDDLRVSEIKTNTTYTVSMDIKCSGSGSVGFKGFLNGNATNSMNQAITIVQGDFSANTWSHIILQTLTKSSFDEITVGSQCVYMTCQFLRTTGSWLMMKNMHVQEGSVDTKWAPSMSDTAYTSLGYSETTVYDSSGFNHHGNAIDSLTISSDSARNLISTYFDGTSSGVLIENLPLSPVINSDITYSFWIKPDGENGARSVYFGSYSANSWSIEKTTSNILRLYWMGNPDEYCSGATISDGVWQHICITKHGSNDVKVYVNGELKWTSTAAHNTLAFPTTYRIGRDVRSGDNTPYKGFMSDFRIYATALSADDVKTLYNAPVSIANNGTMITQGEFVEV